MARLGPAMTLEEFSRVEREIAASQRRMQEEKPFMLRIAESLERIADALETQVAAQEASAAFARLLTKGVPADLAESGSFDDYREEPDGLKVLVGGAWRPATLAEEQEIADMNQKRRRR